MSLSFHWWWHEEFIRRKKEKGIRLHPSMWKTLISIHVGWVSPDGSFGACRENEQRERERLRFPYYYWDLVWTSVLRLKQSRARSQHDTLPIFLSRKESNKRKLTRKRRGFCFPKDRPFLSLLDPNDGPPPLPSNILFFFFFQNASKIPKYEKEEKSLLVPIPKPCRAIHFCLIRRAKNLKRHITTREKKKKIPPRSRHVIGSRRISHGTRHYRKGFRSKTSRGIFIFFK